MVTELEQYHYENADVVFSHDYLFPAVLRGLAALPASGEIFELGCGNGANAARLADRGYRVSGVDPSAEGIAIAQSYFPQCRLELGSSEERLGARFGMFDAVVSLEVVEHIYSPRRYVDAIDELLRPGGVAVVSTPYHGYLKNLSLALSGKLDAHFTALWEGGHIKFWSRRTLDSLFAESGMKSIGFSRVGRIPPLAKSMVCVYRKSETSSNV